MNEWDKLCAEMEAALGVYQNSPEWLKVKAVGDKQQQENKALNGQIKIAASLLNGEVQNRERYKQKLEAILKPWREYQDFYHDPDRLVNELQEVLGE